MNGNGKDAVVGRVTFGQPTAEPTRAGRILATRIAEPDSPPPDLRRALIGTAAKRIADALEDLRMAFVIEANDEGEFAQAIRETQDQARSTLAGCQALMLGMADRARKAGPRR